MRRCTLLVIAMAVAAMVMVGPVPGEAGRWYEDYQAAVGLVEGGICSAEAIELLGAAVVDHPQAGRGIRTYAVRYLDYLPYLQLARAYQACTADGLARHYLQLARQQGAATAAELSLIESNLQERVGQPDTVEPLRRELNRIGGERQQLQEAVDRLETALTRCQQTPAAAVADLLEQDNLVLFGANRTELDTEQHPALARLAGLLSLATGVRLQLEGHADATGDNESNQRISQERAETVRQLLISFGADGDRLTAVGFGADRPVADNTTEQGRQRNRRVEVVLQPGQQE